MRGAFRPTVLLACLASAGAGTCRRTERLPPRPEEEAVPDAPSAVEAPAPPPRLSAPGRGGPERVALATPDGVRIVGDYFAGAGGAAFPAIVLVHGEHGSRLDWQPVVDRLLASPDAIPSLLAIDLRGHGESVVAGGRRLDERRMKEDAAAGAPAWPGVVADVDAALAWLAARAGDGGRAPDAPRPTVLVGSGVGAAAAIRAAADRIGGGAGGVQVIGVVALSPAEAHGVSFSAEHARRLALSGARFFAVAAEDDVAAAPAGVRTIEEGARAAGGGAGCCEVFEAGGSGLALLRGRPDLADRALAFVVRGLAAAERISIPVGGELSLAASLDPALDPAAPAVVLVHDLGRDRGSLGMLRTALADALPWRIVAPDLRGHGESLVDAAGAPVRSADLSDEVPPDDARSFRGLVRDVEATVRFLEPRSYVLAGAGLGATACVMAAAELAEDPALPPPAALVLLSPVPNGHGLSIWPALGGTLEALHVPVFVGAASRSSVSADMADGIGSDARTAGAVGEMLGGDAVVQILPSDAYGERLLSMHPAIIPAIVRFVGERLRNAPASAATAADAGPAGGPPAREPALAP